MESDENQIIQINIFYNFEGLQDHGFGALNSTQ